MTPRNDPAGLKKQESPLCSVYYKAGSPPVTEDEWSVAYTAKKGFARVPVWEIARSKTEMDPAEWWVMETLTDEECSGLVNISPPMQKPAHLQASFLAQFFNEEQSYANLMWSLAERSEQWPAAPVVEILDRLNRPSWDCRQWKRDCSYKKICFQEAGWEDPLSSGYVIREPHHQPELELFASQGITFEKQEQEVEE